jgi:hypothetical protein
MRSARRPTSPFSRSPPTGSTAALTCGGFLPPRSISVRAHPRAGAYASGSPLAADIGRLSLLVLLDFWSRRSRRFTFSSRGPAVTQVGRARRRPRRRIRNQTRASAQPRFWRPVFASGKCLWWPGVRKDPLGRCEGAPRASMRVAVGRRCCVRVWSFCGASSKCALRAP